MTPTPSQTVGPFFGFALLPFDGGDQLRVEGQVLDGAGEAVADALLEISQGDQFARCRTDEEGAFHFTVHAPDAGFFNVTVFARGLLRHLNTRIYLPGAEDHVPSMVDPKRRHTLVAKRDGEVLRFDIRLQGQDETVFFDWS
jgi:protocatechuate 3,4-dioxygenase alpha subunit